MLQSLHVHNFALLEDAHAEFTPGFNVFTGETGAGKSILIDAFGMVLGGRASVDYVRSGTDGCRLFLISHTRRTSKTFCGSRALRWRMICF